MDDWLRIDPNKASRDTLNMYRYNSNLNYSQRMDWIFDDEFEEENLFGLPSPSQQSPVETGYSALKAEKKCSWESQELLQSLSDEERQVLPATLNDMQGQLLPIILGSNENIVVSAPTGAGKTCLLDMAILRSILVYGNLCRMYYVAPSRALCRLQGLGFSKRFQGLNLSVDIVTGDEGGTEEDAGELLRMKISASGKSKKSSAYNIVVCTPEKLEAETRRCSDERLVSNQKFLILVDEVHHLGEAGRGGVLELVLTRFLWAFRYQRENLRFVCVSATIPNVGTVARWLSNALYFEFRERPIPLTVHRLEKS